MIIDDNATCATTSSSFTVNHDAMKPEEPIIPQHTPARRARGRMRRRHSVDFKPAPEPERVEEQVVEVEKMDEDERAQCWYSKDEYDIIKARNSLIVKMMKTGHFRESDEHSFRGLEHKLKEGFKQRRANKFNALNVVLEEQDRQMATGEAEPEKIARKYRRVSLNAAETAMVVAQRDAEESAVNNPEEYQHQPHAAASPAEDMSDVTPSLQYDDSYDEKVSDIDTIASEESNEHPESVRLEVRGLFAAASLVKHSSGRISRRSSM